MGFVANMQHPDTPKLINYLLTRMFGYMGDEYANFGQMLLEPSIPIAQQGGQSPEAAQGASPSNQYGFEQAPIEEMARGMI
jgi:hypothetical protein